MHANVDPTLCIGCTQCAGTCPEVFSMNGNLAEAIPGEIPYDQATKAAEAAQSCPVDAITLQE